MGNSGSTISAKDYESSRVPTPVSNNGLAVPADNVIIFNVGVINLGGFGVENLVVSLTLTADGYKSQFSQTSTVGRSTSAMLQKGFTFALDKNALEFAVLTLKVMNGTHELAVRPIAVKSLKYSGQKYFNQTIYFGELDFPGKTKAPVPTVKMAFELVSVGDGKVHLAKQPHFMDLELARGDGAGVRSHPLGMVR